MEPRQQDDVEGGGIRPLSSSSRQICPPPSFSRWIRPPLDRASPTSHRSDLAATTPSGKCVMNCNSDRATGLPKLKITIPREPELATKLRAERSRILRAVPTNSKQLNKRDVQSSTTQAASTRTVVQPFRTTDHQHANVQHRNVGSNMPACTSNRARHLHNVDKKLEDCRDDLFKFKARPLDKKILASKGDGGVFRSAKRNTTMPKEFNLSTSRKSKQAPLSELFNKLSLTAEARRGIDRQASELPNYITTKDCKENMIGNIRW